MCLAVPSKILRIEDRTAVVDAGGVTRRASLLLAEGVKTGDYVIVHAGFVIQKIDEHEAQAALKLLRQAASIPGRRP